MTTRHENGFDKKRPDYEIFGNAVESEQKFNNTTIASQVKNDSSSYQTTIAASLSILAVIAIVTVLYFASPILIPITLAIYLNLLLSPIVIFLDDFEFLNQQVRECLFLVCY